MKIEEVRGWLGLALCFLVACTQRPTPSELASPEKHPELITQIPLPRSGYIYDVAIANGAAWVTSHGGLFRIDPVTSEAVKVLSHDYLFRALPGYGDLWVTTGSGGQLLRFDPRTNTLDAEIDIGAGPVTEVAMSEDAVWVSAVSDLVRIDPATNEVEDRMRSDTGFGDVTFGAGALWVIAGANEEGAVWRIDPATADVLQKIPLPNPGFWNEMEAGDEAIWITSSPVARSNGAPFVRLHRIDPSTGEITAEVPLGNGAFGLGPDGRAQSLATIAVGQGSVWVLIEIESLLVTVNPANLGAGETLEGVAGGSSDVGSGMAIGAGAIWVTAPGAVTRVTL
jgi:streptogramin lyase